jgi:glycerol dehydrogenase-like iron-containing ADH family enzyme
MPLSKTDQTSRLTHNSNLLVEDMRLLLKSPKHLLAACPKTYLANMLPVESIHTNKVRVNTKMVQG